MAWSFFLAFGKGNYKFNKSEQAWVYVYVK